MRWQAKEMRGGRVPFPFARCASPVDPMRKRWQTKLREVYTELRRRMHDPVPEQGTYLQSVLIGHARYYGVPMNGPSLAAFRKEVCWLWCKVLKRRSQKHQLTWDRMERLGGFPQPVFVILTLSFASVLSPKAGAV
jgi:hypothetical protein